MWNASEWSWRPAALAVVLLLLTAPVGARKPPPEADYLDRSFSSSLVDRIVVLPVADVRIDKSIEMKQPDVIAQRTVRRMFKKSPYTVAYEPASAAGSVVTQDDLDLLEAAWVAELGEAGDRWVLQLEYTGRKSEFPADDYSDYTEFHRRLIGSIEQPVIFQ